MGSLVQGTNYKGAGALKLQGIMRKVTFRAQREALAGVKQN